MTVQIDNLTGAGPASAAVTSCKLNRDDTPSGTTAGIPTPTSAGTKFSWVKSFILEITATGGLSMTNVIVGKLTNESLTGHKLWHYTGHALGSYVQAASAPADGPDNNVTGPAINGATGTAVQLITTPPSSYAAGPYNSTGQKGNLVEVVLGIDNTNSTSGTATSLPTMRWSWAEA